MVKAYRRPTFLADIVRRDERDSSRAVAPLRPASDAYVLDTTTLDIEAAVAAALARVEFVRQQPSTLRNRLHNAK